MNAAGTSSLRELASNIAACRLCVENPFRTPLPHEPRPVAVLSASARIAICGQAPGMRVHQSGIPFTDPSGDRLREWMGVGEDVFYDSSRIAIVPMGFCFPGYDRHGGDLPPRKECRAAWHDMVFAAMPQLELKLVLGAAAQDYHLGKGKGKSVSETVSNWRSYLLPVDGKRVIPLPHPSWRNNAWLSKNPWFEEELLPVLRAAVRDLT